MIPLSIGNQRLYLGNLYHLKARCSDSAKERGAAPKKGRQCAGAEESPEYRKEAREVRSGG